jgi:hypothetical protein
MLQDHELMSESKDLCLRSAASWNTVSRRKEQIQHGWEGYRSRLHKCNDFNVYGLFGRDK